VKARTKVNAEGRPTQAKTGLEWATGRCVYKSSFATFRKMIQLRSPRAMMFKAGLFLLLGLMCVSLLILDLHSLKGVFVLFVCIWAFCRLYYFLFYVLAGWWPTQARFWLEWGNGIGGHILPASRSRRYAVHSDSISTRPLQPVA
jgi:hypothetical protein